MDSKSGLKYLLRPLGVVVGLFFVLLGPVIATLDAKLWPEAIVQSIGFVIVGALFIRYGVAGNVRPHGRASQFYIWLGFWLGILLVTLGIYAFFLDEGMRSFSKAPLWILIGLSSCLPCFIAIRRYMNRGIG